MRQLSELAKRLIGSFIFSAAFVIFVANYNLIEDYIDAVKSKFVEGAVYSQGMNENKNVVFDFDQKTGEYNVSGYYLAGLLNNDITEKIIVIGDSSTIYQKLVIDPAMTKNSDYYTLYKKSQALNGTQTYEAVKSGKWISGESVNLSSVINYSSDKKYRVSIQYAETGNISSITYELH